jgi:hypothetical protein
MKETKRFSAVNPLNETTYWYVEFLIDGRTQTIEVYETEELANTAIAAYKVEV